jgi:hypothetical protein
LEPEKGASLSYPSLNRPGGKPGGPMLYIVLGFLNHDMDVYCLSYPSVKSGEYYIGRKK